jgi:hypothetical protein
MSFQTPILLITFNRPDHTRQVFDAIKKQRPAHLFVFQDGARAGNERDAVNCPAVRAIVDESIDWTCDFHTFYSEKNLGCGKGPATAISWFFDNIEQGIIFEDDCLPHPDFFEYCEILLEKYKNDERIAFIGGSSFQNPNKTYKESYYFSSGFYGTWGWATWKRSWLDFDYYLETMDEKRMNKFIKKYFKEVRERVFLKDIFSVVKENRLNETCWDYQFYFSEWEKNKLAIIPYVNLITNIGYDEMGTHTFSNDHPAAKLTTNSILPLKHAKLIKLNTNADFYVFKNYTLSYEYGWSGFKRIPYRMNKRIKSLFGVKGSWIPKNKKR